MDFASDPDWDIVLVRDWPLHGKLIDRVAVRFGRAARMGGDLDRLVLALCSTPQIWIVKQLHDRL